MAGGNSFQDGDFPPLHPQKTHPQPLMVGSIQTNILSSTKLSPNQPLKTQPPAVIPTGKVKIYHDPTGDNPDIPSSASQTTECSESKMEHAYMGKLPICYECSDEDMPSVTFELETKELLLSKVKHVLIAKFSHGRPAFKDFSNFLSSFKFLGNFNLASFDNKHVFIQFDKFQDFVKLWMVKSSVINGFKIRFFRWTDSFNPKIESAVCPIWVHLPGIPLYLLDEEALLSIGSAIGSPLFIDPRNLDRQKVGYASLCIAVDVSCYNPGKIQIEFRSNGRLVELLTQLVVYDNMPSYCSNCLHLGHALGECKIGNKSGNANRHDSTSGESSGEENAKSQKPEATDVLQQNEKQSMRNASLITQQPIKSDLVLIEDITNEEDEDGEIRQDKKLLPIAAAVPTVGLLKKPDRGTTNIREIQLARSSMAFEEDVVTAMHPTGLEVSQFEASTAAIPSVSQVPVKAAVPSADLQDNLTVTTCISTVPMVRIADRTEKNSQYGGEWTTITHKNKSHNCALQIVADQQAEANRFTPLAEFTEAPATTFPAEDQRQNYDAEHPISASEDGRISIQNELMLGDVMSKGLEQISGMLVVKELLKNGSPRPHETLIEAAVEDPTQHRNESEASDVTCASTVVTAGTKSPVVVQEVLTRDGYPTEPQQFIHLCEAIHVGRNLIDEASKVGSLKNQDLHIEESALPYMQKLIDRNVAEEWNTNLRKLSPDSDFKLPPTNNMVTTDIQEMNNNSVADNPHKINDKQAQREHIKSLCVTPATPQETTAEKELEVSTFEGKSLDLFVQQMIERMALPKEIVDSHDKDIASMIRPALEHLPKTFGENEELLEKLTEMCRDSITTSAKKRQKEKNKDKEYTHSKKWGDGDENEEEMDFETPPWEKEENVPKKRGRPPKQVQNTPEPAPMPKPRGRPKKK